MDGFKNPSQKIDGFGWTNQTHPNYAPGVTYCLMYIVGMIDQNYIRRHQNNLYFNYWSKYTITQGQEFNQSRLNITLLFVNSKCLLKNILWEKYAVIGKTG